MTEIEFGTVIANIVAVYDTFKNDRAKLDIWYENLKDLEYDKTMVILKKIFQTSDFPPTIAMIRKEYSQFGLNKLSTEESLLLINKTIQKYGRYKAVEAMEHLKLSDELTYRIMKAIGYANYCNADPNFTRNTVMKIHNEAVKNQTDMLAIEASFAGEIKQIQNQGFQLMSQGWEE